MKYDIPGKDEITLREHIEQANKVVVDPDLPDYAEHLVEWFWTLRDASGSNGFGFNPINYSLIESWVKMTGEIITPAEIEVIVAMDVVFREEMARRDT